MSGEGDMRRKLFGKRKVKTDPAVFMPHAKGQVYSVLIEAALTEQGRADFLLWKAYLKRIKTPPLDLVQKIVDHLQAAAKLRDIGFDTEFEGELTADLAGELVWNKAGDEARRDVLRQVNKG